MRDRETIYAVSSGDVRAAVAVVRLSGARTAAAIQAVAGSVPPPRRASLRRLRHPCSGEPLDEALVLWMPGPASFTGEDVAEFHVHGGLAVRAALVGALAACEGCRPAEPGEFTRRAFLNGRLDLTRVEGLADLIDAETEEQRRQALRLQGGALSRPVEEWRRRLIEILAGLEAALDFSDEDDVSGVPESSWRDLAAIAAQMGALLADARHGERVREGFTVVIAGAPNAGKSSLLNAIARREVAIVSSVAGTTRDALEIRCDLEGLPVTFVDTAGLRETSDDVERQGVLRARARAAEADLVLWLSPMGDDAGNPVPAPLDPPGLWVRTKADLVEEPDRAEGWAVSALSGENMRELLADIAGRLRRGHVQPGGALIARERQRAAIEEAVAHLARPGPSTPIELAAEDLRLALRALGRLTGRVDVDEVLDQIFSRFCIGK